MKAELLCTRRHSPKCHVTPSYPSKHHALATCTPTLCPHPSCTVARATALSCPSHLLPRPSCLPNPYCLRCRCSQPCAPSSQPPHPPLMPSGALCRVSPVPSSSPHTPTQRARQVSTDGLPHQQKLLCHRTPSVHIKNVIPFSEGVQVPMTEGQKQHFPGPLSPASPTSRAWVRGSEPRVKG